MSRDPRSGSPESAATHHTDGPPLVPEAGFFEGQVAVVGDTRIAGAVIGALCGPGTLHLESTAVIEGPIDCGALESGGRIAGDVHARRRAHLGPGSHFEGDLEAPVVEVDDEATWQGTARIGG